MSFELKLGLFWVLVLAIQWWIWRRPHSTLARWLMTWNGPFPLHGETRSRYLGRKARFAFGWLVQILVVSALLFLGVKISPEVAGSDALMVSMFALALGMGMAMLGALLAGLTAAKAAWLGPNPCFYVERMADGRQVAVLAPPPEAPR